MRKNQPALALCPATKSCISTSENISDLTHYAPLWNYNGERKKPVSRELAMEELLQVVKSTKPDKSTLRIEENKNDYEHGNTKLQSWGLWMMLSPRFLRALRLELEKKGSTSLGNF